MLFRSQSKVLAQIYARLSPEQLKSMGAPSVDDLSNSMARRVVAAFAQYKIPATYAADFKKLVEQHGFPVFLALVFPNAKVPTGPVPDEKGGIPLQDGKPSSTP